MPPARARTLYHGTPALFWTPDLARVSSGNGHDQEGPGFYCTSSPTDAWRYALQDGPDPAVLTLTLRARRWVSTTRPASRLEVAALMRLSADLPQALTDWDEDPDRAFRQALTSIMTHASAHEQFQSVWADFYRSSHLAYVEALASLGYDAVRVQRPEGITHVIVYRPDAITIEEAMRPDGSRVPRPQGLPPGGPQAGRSATAPRRR